MVDEDEQKDERVDVLPNKGAVKREEKKKMEKTDEVVVLFCCR